MSQMKKLYEALVEKACEEKVSDSEGETYHAGFKNGAITFARQLCDSIGISYDNPCEDDQDE